MRFGRRRATINEFFRLPGTGLLDLPCCQYTVTNDRVGTLPIEAWVHRPAISCRSCCCIGAASCTPPESSSPLSPPLAHARLLAELENEPKLAGPFASGIDNFLCYQIFVLLPSSSSVIALGRDETNNPVGRVIPFNPSWPSTPNIYIRRTQLSFPLSLYSKSTASLRAPLSSEGPASA